MAKLDKSQVRAGAFITLDGPATVLSPRRAPPNYGQQPSPFKQVGEQLDAARVRLEQIAKAVRDARKR